MKKLIHSKKIEEFIQSSYQKKKLNSIHKMPIRKNRVVCQGISNNSSVTLLRNQNSFDLSANTNNKITSHSKNKSFNLSQSFSKFDVPLTTMTQHNPFYFSGIEQKLNKNSTLESCNRKENHLTKKCFKTKYDKTPQSNQLSENTAKVLDKIRTAYKYNANISKITKGWGFQSKGYISNDQFHEIIQNHFEKSFTKQNCQEMLKSVGNNRQNIDMKTFIKLVFQQQPFTNPNIDVLQYQQTLLKNKSTQNFSSTLLDRISNLNQATVVNEQRNMFQNNRSFALPNVSSVDIEHKISLNFYSQFGNKDHQKTQPSLYQTMHSSSSPKFTFSTTKSHTTQFTPKLFQGINQQKTRFGATPAIKLNDQSLVQNKREKIFDSKQKVLEDLISEQKSQKMRYFNKLQKIREHQQKEKENILAIDRKVEQRDQANMRKFREQNLAYNYVNFIHNDWK